jgi:hypothetical protein
MEDTLGKEKNMTEWLKAITVRAGGSRGVAQDSMPKSLANGNQSFKPAKPANLVRPQGIKPPPPRRTK